MSAAWVTEIWRFTGVVLAALVAGIAFDHVLAALTFALIGYLLWHVYNLYRLERWLRDARSFNPPQADGIWAEVFHHYYRLQRRNRQRKRRLASLIREFRESTGAMPDGAVVLGAHWEILWFNNAAVRLLSLRVPQDTGQRVTNLVRDPAFIRYVEQGDFDEPVVVAAPRRAGRVLSLHLVPYGGAQHLLLVRDVTRLHQLEQLRRDFVANASHELRTPLTVMSGYLDLLLDDEETREALGKPLNEMRTQADRMQAIVDDLLELSRLENEAEVAPYDRVDAGALLTRVRDESLALRKAGQELVLELNARSALLGIEGELHSAVSNLVTNALAYTPEHGRVVIRFEAGPDGARISVADTGVGIPAEQLPRITERFYRVDRGRARKDGGTGLGLSIVNHALKRHEARLEIESQPGKGSTFTCVFPPSRVGWVTKP